MKTEFLVILLSIMFLSGCVEKQQVEVKETREMMGTFVSITVISADEETGRAAIDDAYEEMQRVVDIMNYYSNGSELSQINRLAATEPIQMSPEMAELVGKSVYYSEVSDGAFDITINPILELWNNVATTHEMPTGEQINRTLELVGRNNLVIDYDTEMIMFKKEGMSINLGGVAKGYAVDKAAEKLKELGVEHALINAGGDMRAIGGKNSDAWTIALQNPRDKNDYITVIALRDMAVTTSGDYERYFIEDDTRITHIADPRTGYSATGVISATIVTETATDADALSTAVFVLGPETGLELIEGLDNVEGLIIAEDRTVIRSSGFEW